MAKTRFVLGTAAVVAGLLIMAGGTPVEAAAQSVVFEPSTVTWSGSNCKAWINTEQINGAWYAQGVVHSWNGADCGMNLIRYHNGSWTQVSNEYEVVNGQTNTGWHWDDSGFKSAVCVIDWSRATNADYTCGYAGAV
ncbi:MULTISPECIES: hypothetical protein [Streptomyces]|uniref:hypothetical protein n=1 Tax=Streptomyces TaxID=1883 RepID=UPI000BD8D764|nr:hypothetical protein [Streptomyces sp. OK228]SOE24924.1 hypothetical protein SAMN05442782_1595 [Streptomyces sp. OK228]